MGRAEDLLTNLVLASAVPKLVVPAMHPSMWSDPATVANVATLRSRGFIVMEPEVGRLTGSDSGQGRFPQTQSIIDQFFVMSGYKRDLVGKKVLVTAGGTREAIDPVRFIGNRSSGKQGIAVAKAAAARGATVHLIAANVEMAECDGVVTTHVESTQQMLVELEKSFADTDILVMTAAVADARPKESSSQKIDKSKFTSIDLQVNPDLLATLSAKRANQVMVGFAAQTSELIASAEAKLISKGLDLIYVNDVTGGAIFGQEETEGTIVLRNGDLIPIARQSKDTLAHRLLDYALEQLG
jgi:phosphopantothenoylcysteine decarboxylase/phosphopantothenate--cysteine ligase